MLEQLNAIGREFHEATKHSYLSVMIDPNYVDSSTQPTVFKSYPHFYRRFPLDLENPIHSFIHLTSRISYEKAYKNETYFLRVNPSAGALYPTEIYLQIRGVKGFIDGIYHLEIKTNTLTLIYELINDGIEFYLFPTGLVKGIIFLVSCVYFRSSWKYKNRSLRYCFLDSGHHIGAIEASAWVHSQPIHVLFEFDKLSLNRDLGFENKEFITACVIAGNWQDKSVKHLYSPVPFVSATDYFEANSFIEKGYQKTVDNRLSSLPKIEDIVSFNYPQLSFQESILNRRSARSFKKGSITQQQLTEICQFLQQSLPLKSREKLDIYYVINRVEGLTSGLYLQDKLLKQGDFTEKSKYLCVNQALGRDSAINFFITSDYDNYQTVMQLAGWVGHRLYLISQYLQLQCSGIGAYYDEETQAFLGTSNAILYVVSIGK